MWENSERHFVIEIEEEISCIRALALPSWYRACIICCLSTSHAINSEMVATPPLLLIGMEGFWGLLLCVFVLYPIAYFTPGPDHGSLENPFNTYAQLSNSTDIQICLIVYFFSVSEFRYVVDIQVDVLLHR
jgi:hypothetical protein